MDMGNIWLVWLREQMEFKTTKYKSAFLDTMISCGFSLNYSCLCTNGSLEEKTLC